MVIKPFVKGSVRIGGAVVLGVIVILSAFYVRSQKNAPAAEAIVVAEAPARNYIPTTDTDGDGIKDWEEALQARVFDLIEIASSTEASSTEPYTEPTTLTGKFSQAFLREYVSGKISYGDPAQPLSEEERSLFINDAVAAAKEAAKSRQFSPVDIIIVPDSESSLHAYGNKIVEMMFKNQVKNEDPLVILNESLKNNDPEMLASFSESEAIYAQLVADTRSIETPQSMVDAHLALVNAYEAVRTDIAAMQLAYSDTLYSLVRVQEYVNDSAAMLSALREIKNRLNNSKIYYTKEEPGSLFYAMQL